MNRARRILLTAALCAPLVAACEPIRGWLSSADRCVLSERSIHRNMAVHVAVEGGPSGRACCLRCAITYSRQTGKRVRVDWVTDHAEGRRIPPDRAVYVVGSDVAPCAAARDVAAQGRRELLAEIWDRCRTSTIAFGDLRDARAFQQEHGGTLRTFRELAAGEKVVAAPSGAS